MNLVYVVVPLIHAPILVQRQRQIDIGKGTESYKRYIEAVPVASRKAGAPIHPMVSPTVVVQGRLCVIINLAVCVVQTPDRSTACSKRAWDGQVNTYSPTFN